MARITLTDVSKSFGTRSVLRNVNLEVQSAEVLVIMGPSGCGKTTLLKLIAGDLPPDQGTIAFEGFSKRDIGFILQRLNVFPWLTVRENIGFGLKGFSRGRARAIDEMIKLLGLDGSDRYYPSQLSGGMLQRVAIGRTLILKPQIILMDEPFTGLDYARRRELHAIVRKMREDTGVSIVLVTHDIEDAVRLGTRIVVLSEGPGEIQATHADVHVLNDLQREEFGRRLVEESIRKSSAASQLNNKMT
jgi:ABC-type nitrate/sulfonate/bicarbonate transport system ATPase subunit